MTIRVSENEQRMREHGMTIASAPVLHRALTESAAPVIAAWVEKAGPTGQALLAQY